MGNSQGKESRIPQSPSRSDLHSQGHTGSSPRPEAGSSSAQDGMAGYSRRHGRGSGPDLSFLGINANNDRDFAILETRRETKQEREARKIEKERVARLKERERSMKEEHVDGGYLVTQGVYVGTEDFNKQVVRQLMIERKLAPFWRGLNDYSESWAEHQLMAAARGMEIPPADQVPPELEYRISPKVDAQTSEKNIKNLTVPIGSRSQSFNSDSSAFLSPSNPAFSLPSPTSPISSPVSSGTLFRTRAKTLASLTTSSRNNSQTDMTPRELQLPKDPFVNGQPIEVYLYKDASECPICFLYYPPYLNTTRCCDQPICSECFVQIKRPDPHPPEHHEDGSQPAAPPTTEAGAEGEDGQLVSEPSTCPFCKMPEFGVTYASPPFRRGLTYGFNPGSIGRQASAMSSQSSLSSANQSTGGGRRRGQSLSTTAPGVITTDRIRPDWATKLATARAHAARRSAAATALHTAAYLMGNNSNNREGIETRTIGTFGRRMRRAGSGDESPGTSNAHINALAFLAERAQQQQARQRAQSNESSEPGFGFLPGPISPRHAVSRRNRVEDLEEMMMMEAIRLSLAAEEERRKKEEKEAKKEAKKKEKADRKAEKASKKSNMYSMNANASSTGFESNGSSTGSVYHGRTGSGSSLNLAQTNSNGKGKAIDRETPSGNGTPPGTSSPTSPSFTQPQNIPSISVPQSSSLSTTDPLKKSHLRHMSTASSSASSMVDQAGTSLGTDAGFPSSSTPESGADTEPMFNFKSLAETLIAEGEGEDREKQDQSGTGEHVEHVDATPPPKEDPIIKKLEPEQPSRPSQPSLPPVMELATPSDSATVSHEHKGLLENVGVENHGVPEQHTQ